MKNNERIEAASKSSEVLHSAAKFLTMYAETDFTKLYDYQRYDLENMKRMHMRSLADIISNNL